MLNPPPLLPAARRPRLPRARIAALVMLAAGMASPALSQSEEIYRAQTGRWLIAATNGQPGCVVTLDAGRAIGGRVIRGAESCARTVPIIASAAAWDMGEGVVLRDATRKTLATFSEDETAILTDSRQKLLMVPAVPGVDRLPHADAVFGRWEMRRPGGPPLCTVTFAERPTQAGADTRPLTLAPGCDSAVSRLKLASWRIEGPHLMLYGPDGDSLGFALTAEGFAKRKAEGGRPLLMQRAR
jgi:hypothetical protein